MQALPCLLCTDQTAKQDVATNLTLSCGITRNPFSSLFSCLELATIPHVLLTAGVHQLHLEKMAISDNTQLKEQVILSAVQFRGVRCTM